MGDLHNPTWRVGVILNCVSKSKKGLSLTDCSKEVKIPVGTLHPIMKTLKEMKFLEYHDDTKTYTTGIQTFLAGVSYNLQSKSYAAIQNVLSEIVDICGEAAHFGTLEKGYVLYVAKVDSKHPIRMFSAIGLTLPAYGTAIGKSLLADFSLEDLKKQYPKLTSITKNTITNPEELYSQLKMIKNDGFSYEMEESNESIRCVACPVYQDDKVVAAISVAVPIFRYTNELEISIKRELVKATINIEKILPYISL